MGFRSYIRECSGAILMLFRPSLPWCFPIREVPFEQKESQEQEQQQQQQEPFEQKESQEQEQQEQQQQQEETRGKSN